MLAPQYSIRQILAIMTALGVFFVTASLSTRGHMWAAAIAVVGFTLLMTFLLYGLCFLAAWCVSLAVGRLGERPARQSPFARDAPPPHVIPREESG